MRETQQTISEWADATFGLVSGPARVLGRATEELAELIRAITAGAGVEQILDEAADTAIVLVRAAHVMGVEIARTEMGPQARPRDLDCPSRVIGFAVATGRSLMDAIDLAEHPSWWAASGHLRCAFISLGDLAHRLGFDLWELIDIKMAVNRTREWTRAGNGIGYHRRIHLDTYAPVAGADAHGVVLP